MASNSTNLFQTAKSLPKGVWAVSISMMLIAISTTMVFSISPFYITQVLGLSFISLGIMEGVSEGLSFFAKLASGFAGDFFRRKKPPLVIGVAMATISKPIFILAGGAGMIMVSKVIERIANGIMATPRDAYCAEEVTAAKRGSSLGLMMSLKTFGCALGSFIIGGLIIFTDDYRFLLWIGFVPCFLSLVVLLYYMKEKRVEKMEAHPEQKRRGLKKSDFKGLKARYWSLVVIATIFMAARFSDGFLILRMQELGAPKWLYMSTIGLFNLISAFACLPIGRLSDRIDRSRMLYFSFIALVVANICFIFEGGLFLALVGVVFWGAQRGTSQLLFAAIIADEVPEKIIGTALGLYYLLSGVIAVFAGFMAGHFADMSLNYAFIFGLSASSLALIALVIRNEVIRHAGKKSKAEKCPGPLSGGTSTGLPQGTVATV
ncbi:MAG: MFS transporter [Alphaproteobacteria bacterium]|nr:MFS transporter [Alphaproteobacteria bacterium]NCQ66383.1 MFS transporter [Alphaproteobacteria bacterium]NCT06868.1 MFS transporter [Alphaproteobacteria bacterium]